VVAAYLSQWWRSAVVGRGAGKDVLNVPFDIEVKARSSFQPLAFIKQSESRAKGQEKSIVVCRMNGQGETPQNYLAFMRFSELVDLLLMAGYGDIQQDSVQLEPERCAQCGSWKLVGVPCRTCEKLPNADL
jgi:hypothetical protein